MAIGNGVVIRFLADTGSAIRDIGKLERATGKSMTRMQKAGAIWSKNIGPALATGAVALGAAAGAAIMKGVTSAVEDESSQAKLAQAMRNTIGATEDQIAAVEDYISAAQRRTGVDDTTARTGLARLLRSTRNVTRAQQIFNTALEISASTGKPLGQVVEALAKYNDGNTGALKRLGITMGEATRNYGDYVTAVKSVQKAELEVQRARETFGPKSKEYADAQEKLARASEKVAAIKGDGGIKWLSELNEQFKGSTAAQAETYAGKMERISTAYNELVEAFGSGIIGNLGGANDAMGDLDDTMYDLQPTAEEIGKILGGIATSVADTAKYIGPVVDGFNRLNSMGDGILTNGTLVNVADSMARIRYLTALATGNEVAAMQAQTDAGLPVVLTGTSGGDFSNPYDSYRPMRTKQRYNDATRNADSRGAQKEARTRQPP